ncbi:MULTISPECIES: MmgE/PrpD family protein [Rhizobium]|uniref:2-methylcitrate dehydratase PrpD n=1 Tax=Rhizobium paranaense TaxID=1650438 RepID=A0A7W9D1S4_9HYPH|nr:MmgE/PrpD family protein [Rhizobium paranaense]MBB5574639.1 2-methylcitrate dehydratase PrpD [Rhizobium paranaense]
MTNNYLQELASLVHGTKFADLPAATVEKAKLHLLDTLGAGIAGAGSDEAHKALSVVSSASGRGPSQIWGRTEKLSPRDAGFLNGVSSHAYELDDCGGCDHSGAVVVPAILALLPVLDAPLSGMELLLSMTMGYEVGRRVLEACGGYEAHNALGWHSTGTCGAFGAAAGAGVLLGLDETKLVSSMGIACSFAGGTWAFIHDGSQAKKLHSGRAAEGGVMAALLAAASFRGPTSVLQPDTWGSYISTFGQNKGAPPLLTAGFGERWRLDRCSVKPYATCRGTHSAIDAVEEMLARHSLSPATIASIEARMSVFQAGMCGATSVETRAQAQMSLPYAVAAKLAFGRVFLAELEELAFQSPEVSSWLERISVHVDPDMADDAEPEITLVTTFGERFSLTVDEPLGSPRSPLPQQRIVDKFSNLAERRLAPDRVRQVVDYVLEIDSRPDVRDLPMLLAQQ